MSHSLVTLTPKRGLVYRAKKTSGNAPRKFQPALTERPCITCRKLFMSWNVRKNQRCSMECTGVAW
jgi:hypothetical protein